MNFKNPLKTPFEEAIKLFWARVERTASCWNWTGSKHPKGYGQLTFMGYDQKAHRLSYLLHNGEIPEGLCVMHICDNPSCVNPSHLKLGTNQDNSDDKVTKGRQYRPTGEKNPAKILSEQKVQEIRQKYKTGLYTQLQLAIEYGTARSTIAEVTSGRTWFHDVRPS